MPNGRTPDDPHYAYKLAWLAALRDALVADVAAGPLVVAGDFNVAPTDDDVWDPACSSAPPTSPRPSATRWPRSAPWACATSSAGR